RGAGADAGAGVRAAAPAGRAPAAGLQPRPPLGADLGRLRRPHHRRGAHPPPAREDRGGPGPPALHRDGVGRGLPLRGDAEMRTLRIRKWMIVGMLIFLVLTGLFYHITDVLERQVLQPVVQQQAQQQDAAVGAVLRDIARSPARWHDPGWQRSLRNKLDKLGVAALILYPSGATIFRMGHVWAGMP